MKTVFITGISRGLGKALFDLFTSEDYFVFGLLRNRSEAQELEKDIPDNAKIITADLVSDESMALIKQAVEDIPIDLLINNAGVEGNSFLIDDIESEEILNLFNIHCVGVFRAVKAMKKNLLKAENPIVLNLNSRLGSITCQSNGTYEHLTISYSYRIAKAAQNMLTNCLRSEFKESIRFISIHPGRMKTTIASQDADLEPNDVAKSILSAFENEKLKEENGIVELGQELIEW